MTAQDINKINIPDFLASLGCFPDRKFHGYWMYKTPWKEQRSGSLKVDLKKGLWIDFSTDEGGTLIDLILKIYPNLSVQDIVRKFSQGHFSFHPLNVSPRTYVEKPTIQLLKKGNLAEHPELCKYLSTDRGIDPDVASKYISVYQYQYGNRRYWNLGTLNHAGGLNLFSKGFKRATKQGYTLYENKHSDSRVYFEGIVDFLSFLMIYPDQESQHEYCILNTVNNLRKSFEDLSMKSITIGFLDNDQAGERATKKLKERVSLEGKIFYDYRKKYKEFKDLNDYLLGSM